MKPAAAAPLPVWRETETGWHCDDPSEMTFAWMAKWKGFDVPDFDNWLRALEPCAARDELLQRRRQAKAADPNNGHQKIALEWLLLRRYGIEREGFLLPLARKGAAMKKKPGDVMAATRFLRENRKRGETARAYWQRLKIVGASDELPIYFDRDDDILIERETEREIKFESFEKRLIVRPKK